MQRLYCRYLELKKQRRIPAKQTFREFFGFWLARRRGRTVPGIDDGIVFDVKDKPFESIEKIDPPNKKLSGTIKTIVLLVDFEDEPHANENSVGVYEEMLFGSIPSGSMREYYDEISKPDR